jgi:hypothetical protein
MTKNMPEILDDLNKNDNAAKYADNTALQIVLACAHNPELKFTLPNGDPPYKPAAQPVGMTPTNFIMETRKFRIFTKDRNDISRIKKEQLFIEMLEGVHPTEAKVLLAIKDQTLPKLYPKLTYSWVEKNFPGLLPTRVESGNVSPAGSAESPQTDSSQPVKRGRGRPPKVK